jgi:enediyne biosynthesis protein E4
VAAPPDGAPRHFAFSDVGGGLPFRLTNGASGAKHQIETMLGGVALFDYDRDGLLDIYAVNGGRPETQRKETPAHTNRLYRNLGGEKFEDVTDKAGVAGQGYGFGVAAADFDNDGWPDLYVTGFAQNQLFRNRGDGSFEDVTRKALGAVPALERSFAVSAGWSDFDNDGWLDLFVVRYVDWSAGNEPDCRVRGLRTYCSPKVFRGLTNLLFRNRGDGSFEDVSKEWGLANQTGKGMGLAFADYDRDGRTDVFVANDTMRHFLFRNAGGHFEETALAAGVAYTENGREIAGMGADFRDWSGDGRPDLFVTGMFHDTFPLYRNDGKTFQDVTAASGVGRATARLTGWSNGIYDFDNDGWKDLFAANGAILDNSDIVDGLPYLQENLILRNGGGERFEAHSLGRKAAHRGAAFGDLNNDGRIDIVTTSVNGRCEVLLNRSAPGNAWLSVRLQGKRSNRDGLGAEIELRGDDGRTQYNHATTSVGYSSSSDVRVHFGLGRANKVQSLTVRWPGGNRQTIQGVEINREILVREEEGQ